MLPVSTALSPSYPEDSEVIGSEGAASEVVGSGLGSETSGSELEDSVPVGSWIMDSPEGDVPEW
jgi:hypothetical protein